jgi:hypothetical protein
MHIFRRLKTFYAIGWWHGKHDYPNNDTYVSVPIYGNQDFKQQTTSRPTPAANETAEKESEVV